MGIFQGQKECWRFVSNYGEFWQNSIPFRFSALSCRCYHRWPLLFIYLLCEKFTIIFLFVCYRPLNAYIFRMKKSANKIYNSSLKAILEIKLRTPQKKENVAIESTASIVFSQTAAKSFESGREILFV